MKIETQVKKDVTDRYFVEFTIGVQTFKTISHSTNGSAAKYADNLHGALSRLSDVKPSSNKVEVNKCDAYTTEQIDKMVQLTEGDIRIDFDFDAFKAWFNKILKVQPQTKPTPELTDGETYVYTGEDVGADPTLKKGDSVRLEPMHENDGKKCIVSVGVEGYEVNKSDLAPLSAAAEAFEDLNDAIKELKDFEQNEEVKIAAESVVNGTRTIESFHDSFRQKVAEEVVRMKHEKKYDHVCKVAKEENGEPKIVSSEFVEKEITPNDYTPEQQQDIIEAFKEYRPRAGSIIEPVYKQQVITIKSKKDHDTQRVIEIAKQIIKCKEEGLLISLEWIEELKELTSC